MQLADNVNSDFGDLFKTVGQRGSPCTIYAFILKGSWTVSSIYKQRFRHCCVTRLVHLRPLCRLHFYCLWCLLHLCPALPALVNMNNDRSVMTVKLKGSIYWSVWQFLRCIYKCQKKLHHKSCIWRLHSGCAKEQKERCQPSNKTPNLYWICFLLSQKGENPTQSGWKLLRSPDVFIQ